MKIQKGQVLNPKGRPPQSTNKSTSEIRAAFQLLISNNLEKLQTDLDNLEPKDRINYILKMSEFVLPKHQSWSLENQLSLEYKQLEQLLLKVDENSLEIISQKIINLNQKSNEQR